MGFKEWIIPQDKVFFNLFEKQSQLANEAAEALNDMVQNFTNVTKKREKIKEIETQGDGVVHEIFDKLNRTFITPFDHEDISKLATAYDDVIDYIYAVASRIVLFKIKKPTDEIKKFVRIILKTIKEINYAMANIRKLKQKEMEKAFVKVHTLENEADDLLDECLASLLNSKKRNMVEILVLKEIYEYLEMTTDKCEDVCIGIQNIIIKHS